MAAREAKSETGKASYAVAAGQRELVSLAERVEALKADNAKQQVSLKKAKMRKEQQRKERAESQAKEDKKKASTAKDIQKAKAKKTKIGVISAVVVVSAIVGPPLARWVIDAVNEAGNVSSVVEPAD